MLETWRQLPFVARSGLAVMAAGLLLDVGLHVLAAESAPEHASHAVILFGMALVVGAVLADGMARARHLGKGAWHADR